MTSEKKERLYKRYKHKTEVLISSEGSSFTGMTVDYSLKGIGFIIDGLPDLPADSSMHFRIKALNLDAEGKMVWAQKFDSYTRGGIERRSISGSLKHYRFADILIDLQRSEKNGVLNIKDGPVVKNIYIKNGDMIFADSNKEEDRFLETLLNFGQITSDQYYQVIDISKKKGKSHGAILVALGFLKPEDLIRAVKHQVEDIILSIFQLEDGEFAFLEGPVVSEKIITLKLSASSLIYRGIKRIKKIAFLESVMQPMDTVLSHSTNPLDSFQDINLDKTDKDILSLVDGRRSIKEIISLSPTDRFQTAKTLEALISVKIVDLGEKGSPGDRIHEDIFEEPISEVDAGFWERVEEIHKKLNSGDYYGALNIEKWATFDKIKRAYYTLAKEFHPDKHLHLPSETLKNKLNSIFSGLTSIYRVLSDPKKKMEYDKTSAIKSAKLQGNDASVSSEANNVELAKSRFREGKAAFKEGSYAASKEFFGQAVYLDSSVPSYQFYLGLALMKENNFREAGKVLNKALTLDPMNADYLAELGHVYIMLGFKLRAKSAFEKATNIDPLNMRAAEGLQVIRDH